MIYCKNEPVPLKKNSEYSESWVQGRITEDPSILGLGELRFVGSEKIQRAGRLDLLLSNYNRTSYYEVELQLGSVDGSHIFRTIEYWDVERKRLPQYKHYPVLVAEDVTSRFLNVIEHLDKTVPLILLQMEALKVGEYLTLVFTKVLDRRMSDKKLTPDVTDEDEEVPLTYRTYWENEKGTEETIALMDEVLEIARNFDSTLELHYTKGRIILTCDGRPSEFMTFRPQKRGLRLGMKIEKSRKIDEMIDSSTLENLGYTETHYRITFDADTMKKERKIIEELVKLTFDERNR